MDTPVLADQNLFIIYVWTTDATKRICQEQWLIGMDIKRESIQSTHLDDNSETQESHKICHQ